MGEGNARLACRCNVQEMVQWLGPGTSVIDCAQHGSGSSNRALLSKVEAA